MTSASEHTEAVSTQPSDLPHVPNAPETEHSPPMAQTTTLLVDDTADITRDGLPANESMALQEKTMVASVEDDVENGDAFQPIERQPNRMEADAEYAEKGMVDSDPLHNPRPTHFSTDPKEAQDVTIVEEEVDVVNSNGHTLYLDIDTKPAPTASKGASHLRLDFKPPSPQPWELVEPPSEENGKGDRGFYSVGAQKFHAVQGARYVLCNLI